MHKANRKRAANNDRRRALDAQRADAIKREDWPEVTRLQAELDAIRPKSNGRPSSKVYRDPHDPELVAYYEGRSVDAIAEEYAKEIRMDFGFAGVVAGVAALVDNAIAGVDAGTLAECLDPSNAQGHLLADVRRAVVRAVCRKLDERVYGMGCLYVERANQILRKLYAARTIEELGLRPPSERRWVGKRELPALPDWDAAFEKDWQEFLADYEDGPSEAPGPSDGPETAAAPADATEGPPEGEEGPPPASGGDAAGLLAGTEAE